MYSKIARSNVKKSLRDYTLYFLTLTFAVCIFYSFNTVESQQVMFELNANQESYMELLSNLIGMVSIFVSMILGGLIIYANNFLIKKRKKELGIYMTLGMGKNKISKILFFETLLIGVVALISGLALGIVLSQGLSIVVANLFEVGMNEYQFILSTEAIIKTAIYFGIIFIVIMLFNTWLVSKYKLIDLLNASRKNEEMKAKNPIIITILCMIALILIGIAYGIVIKEGLNTANGSLQLAMSLGVAGTFTFFYSSSGFVLYLLQCSKGIYFKKLNIFVMRQMNSKINTNFISMSIICLMLVLTIGMLSTGLGFKSVIEKSLEEGTPFDATATMYNIDGDPVRNVQESFEKVGVKFDLGERYVAYYEYELEVTIRELLQPYMGEHINETFEKLTRSPVHAIKLSDYNAMLKIEDRKQVSLEDDEVFIASNFGEYKKIVDTFLQKSPLIEVNGKTYSPKNKKALEDQFATTGFKDNSFMLIVPDSFDGLQPVSSVVNINYAADKYEETEEKYTELFGAYRDGKIKYEDAGFVIGYTKTETQEMNKGLTSIILFIGIYMGIVFLLASAAVLGLQQLSEAGDSIERYKVLRKIGVSKKMINRAILVQVAIYFTLPLGVAFVHAAVGISVINNFLKNFGKPDIGIPSMITALMLAVVYGGYFLATYSGYKNIIKNN